MTSITSHETERDRLSNPEQATIDALIAKLSDPDGEVRKRASFALVRFGSAAVDPLIRACNTPDHRVCWEMCKTLSLIGDPAAVPVFIKALEDDHFEIRWMAAEGLIAIGRKQPESLKALLHALVQHPNSFGLREGAHHVFHDLVVYHGRTEFKPLVSTLASFDWTAKTPAAVNEVLDNLAG